MRRLLFLSPMPMILRTDHDGGAIQRQALFHKLVPRDVRDGIESHTFVSGVEPDKPGKSLVDHTLKTPPKQLASTGILSDSPPSSVLFEKTSNTRYRSKNVPSSLTARSYRVIR